MRGGYVISILQMETLRLRKMSGDLNPRVANTKHPIGRRVSVELAQRPGSPPFPPALAQDQWHRVAQPLLCLLGTGSVTSGILPLLSYGFT